MNHPIKLTTSLAFFLGAIVVGCSSSGNSGTATYGNSPSASTTATCSAACTHARASVCTTPSDCEDRCAKAVTTAPTNCQVFALAYFQCVSNATIVCDAKGESDTNECSAGKDSFKSCVASAATPSVGNNGGSSTVGSGGNNGSSGSASSCGDAIVNNAPHVVVEVKNEPGGYPTGGVIRDGLYYHTASRLFAPNSYATTAPVDNDRIAISIQGAKWSYSILHSNGTEELGSSTVTTAHTKLYETLDCPPPRVAKDPVDYSVTPNSLVLIDGAQTDHQTEAVFTRQ